MVSDTGHTLKAFDSDLSGIRALVSEMGERAVAAIDEAIESLAHRDFDRAARVIEADARIDELEAEIERQVIRLIALRAPLADDLREVLAALKISGVVERMGDYAKNIAKRVPSLAGANAMESVSILPAMARAVSGMVGAAFVAFRARDAEAAVAVCESDRAVDDFYNSLFRTLLTHMLEDPHNITPATHLLFIGKNLERIGDHATNVAEMVYFAATGQQMAERPKGADLLSLPTPAPGM